MVTTKPVSPPPYADPAAIETQRAKAGFSFREDMAPGVVLEMDLKRILHSTESPYQQIDVIETVFGKTLVTDGKTQSTQSDEFAYHESLVHPAMLNFAHHNGSNGPKKVFIGGGGELATAREILRHHSVERCVMVDLDEKVVEVSVQILHEWGGEAVKNDPRFELITGDAYAYLLECKETFDVIVMDISDPIEAGPGVMLYTKELYERVVSCLSPNGVFVTQAGAADAVPPPHATTDKERDTICFGPIRNTLQEVFSCVLPYSQGIPSFGSDWGFVMAFNHRCAGDAKDVAAEWSSISPSVIDELIEGQIKGGESSLKMYDGITHLRMFNLSKAVRKHMERDTRIMTEDNPIFMY
ncbi:spermidine synthase / putrescine aminopropyltransferase [Nitzschia inconspicua]|uniref:thermospermine synthase n=2 Tax=Nitzschia inconspicua TaxID=303405 RepID=A0A9K3PRC9_9STRA|nr:spermidine synthase / putrescine aminopropyltransferase [Nitzschia inconspicua]